MNRVCADVCTMLVNDFTRYQYLDELRESKLLRNFCAMNHQKVYAVYLIPQWQVGWNMSEHTHGTPDGRTTAFINYKRW